MLKQVQHDDFLANVTLNLFQGQGKDWNYNQESCF